MLAGDPVRALEIQKESVRRFPGSPEALVYLGLRHAQLGQKAEARAALEEGIRRFPADPSFPKALAELDGSP